MKARNVIVISQKYERIKLKEIRKQNIGNSLLSVWICPNRQVKQRN